MTDKKPHELDQWCPTCGCPAGAYSFTGKWNENQPEKHHYACLNCGTLFDRSVEDESHE